jgi:DNA invertase Pin-like site-specific DNA recombinase
MTPTKKLIPYYRVSTKKQEESGLGLDAQQAAVAAFQLAYGGEVLKSYQETETGKIAERLELQKAIAHAKRSKATLVVAKLDRLARNVEFTAKLMNSGVEFVACDNPHANRLTIHILAAVAEDEAKRISERTSAALTAFVENQRVPKRIQKLYPEGVPADVVEATAGKLGAAIRPVPADRALAGSVKSAEVRQANARQAYADLAPMVEELRSSGLPLREIAARLDAEGHTTRSGKPWNPMQVSRVLEMGA